MEKHDRGAAKRCLPQETTPLNKRIRSRHGCGIQESERTCWGSITRVDVVALHKLKLISIVENRFEAPGFSDSRNFLRAVHRQSLLFREGIKYESDSRDIDQAIYTPSVADWDALAGRQFHIRWWCKGMEKFRSWERNLNFWTIEDLQEAHSEWLSHTDSPLSTKVDLSMFWSAALLFKNTGSCGTKSWDAQFHSTRSEQ